MKKELNFIYADDEVFLHRIIKRGLEMAFPNYQVSTDIVLDGCDLYDRVVLGHEAGKPYHGIVTDNHMPTKNGLQALLELQERGYIIPALIITGAGGGEVTRRMGELRQTRLLEKPFVMQLFLDTLHEILPEYVPHAELPA